ncbi:hypothetical protein [Burkholderia sp. LMG 32019]|uniref:hypothetical protein n=1 Tax=Burkholderia sp. LMG 32019 TaxID=3158173 RepID=UPI003C304416
MNKNAVAVIFNFVFRILIQSKRSASVVWRDALMEQKGQAFKVWLQRLVPAAFDRL